MKCNKCGEEWLEPLEVCPACGAPVEEEPETEACPEPEAEVCVESEDEEYDEFEDEEDEPEVEKKQKQPIMVPLKMVLLVSAVVLLAVVLVGVVLMGMIRNELGATEPTVETTQPPLTVPADGNPEDVTCKGSYSATAEKLAPDTVVATMGSHKLTNGQLQTFYWMSVYEFINRYSYYLSYVGMDYTQPLDMQTCGLSDENITWQQYFVREAILAWQDFRLLADLAAQENWKLPQEYQDIVDGLEESMKQEAQDGGFDSVEAMLATQVGEGVTMADYQNYVNLYYTGHLYREYLMETVEVTDAELEAYFTKYEAELKEGTPSITKDSGDVVSVRHILIMPKSSSDSDSYTDAEWEACRAEAQAIYQQWLSGEKTQDSFSALANEKSEDKEGNVTDGGIYSGVYQGQMVEEFDAWCFEAGRQPGDHAMIKTQFGYHIMYYVGNEPGWIYYSRAGAQEEKVYAMEDQMVQDNPVQTEYGSISIAVVDLSAG